MGRRHGVARHRPAAAAPGLPGGDRGPGAGLALGRAGSGQPDRRDRLSQAVSLHRRHDLRRPALPGPGRPARLLADAAGAAADRDHARSGSALAALAVPWLRARPRPAAGPGGWASSPSRSPPCFPLVYAMVARPTAYNALRHFIFVAAAPGDPGRSGPGPRAAACWHRGMRRIAQAAIVAGCLLPVIRMVQLHPYEYVYFNDLSGGVPAAAGRYELDYWGTSFAELGRLLEPWLAAHRPPLDPRPVPAKICGPLEAAREILPASLAAAAARRAGRSRHRDRDLLLRRPARGERDRPGRAPGRGAQPCLPHRTGRGDHQLHHALSGDQTQPPSTM